MSIQFESNPSTADFIAQRMDWIGVARFIHSGRRESTTDYDDDAVERDCVRR